MSPNNTIISLDVKNFPDILMEIAGRVRQRRLELDLTQEGLAVRAGVALPTYRKFEHTGLISLKGLIKIAFALECVQDFDSLFSRKQYRSIDDVLNESKLRQKKRGKQK